MPSGPAHADAASEPGDPVPAPDWTSRVEAYACARKHAAVAEFIRRRADPDAATGERSGMPQMWDEFAVDELRLLLAEHRGAAEDLMSRSHDLAVKLPGTMALFGAGRLPQAKVK